MDPMNRELIATMYAAEAVLGIDDYCIEYLGAYRWDPLTNELKKQAEVFFRLLFGETGGLFPRN